MFSAEIRNCFNILLVGLAAFDSFYLFGAILESFRKYFPALKTDLHVELFPKLLYPLHQTAIAGSIFMTVAIAFERYTAVHFPMNYNQVSKLKVNKFQNQNMKSSHCPKYERKNLKNPALMPCPFTGPKLFWAGPNFLCQTKSLFTYCGSHKHFVPDKKMICIQYNCFLFRHKSF